MSPIAHGQQITGIRFECELLTLPLLDVVRQPYLHFRYGGKPYPYIARG